ncbi:MAG: hypothetical protein DRG24_06125 [Epsilonproteobacteria bacterium]|nr:MAG: hypothetical protein DRG24_06125 [Campylobacterota bacterium]
MTLLMPQWFWLLLPLGISLLYHYNTTGNLAIQKRFIWLLFSMLFLIIALSQPVLTKKSVDVEQVGSDVVIALDLSHSMQAEDIEPTRLRAAKNLLTTLVNEDKNNRFGVIGFTTNAIVLSPLTNDAELLVHLFEGVDETLIMTKGSAMMPALELSRKMSRSASPTLFLFTDGGDKRDYSEEAQFAKRSGLVINVVMLASRSGSTLKLRDGTLLKDENGDIVVTSQNRAIEILSRITGGVLIDGADLSAVQKIIESQSDKRYKSKTKLVQNEELFYYFIALALLFFMFASTTLSGNFQQWLKRRFL